MIERHQRPLACVAAVLLLLGLHWRWGIAHFPHDAGEYWDLARPGVFFEYASHRGYLFPLLLVPVRWLCTQVPDPVVAYRICMSLAYGVALPLLLPAVFTRAFGGRITFARRLVPVVLLAVLFPGLLLYPLSDLPALLLACGALWCALAAMEEGVQGRARVLWLATGALAGAAYNTRPIYVFAAGALVLLAILGRRGHGSRGPDRLLAAFAVLLGVVLVLLPQLAINRATHGVATLAVRPVVNQRSVFASQLVWGLTLQRYETTIAPDAPAPTVYYLDPAGERLYRELAAQGDLFSLATYARGVLAHPLAFAGLYARHVVNGLDVRDGIVYTRAPSPTRPARAALNLAVLLGALWVGWARLRAREQRPASDHRAAAAWPFAVAVLLLPVAAIVPGAVETRFFLPLHALAYACIAFWFDGEALRRLWRERALALVLVSALLASACIAVSQSTMSRLQSGWPEAYRHGTLPP